MLFLNISKDGIADDNKTDPFYIQLYPSAFKGKLYNVIATEQIIL